MDYKDYCEYYDRPTDKDKCRVCSVYPDTKKHPCPHKGSIADRQEDCVDVMLTNPTDEGAVIQFRINGRAMSDFFVAKEQLESLVSDMCDYLNYTKPRKKINGYSDAEWNEYFKKMEE